MKNCIVTIVTVSYNAKTIIKKTIESVLEQTYSSVEYIIIDGLSTDGTTGVINDYAAGISCFESQQDAGLYYAMNRAISLAHGEYLLFLNCGDCLYDENVISDFVSFLETCKKVPDIIYGNVVQERDFGNLFVKPLPLNQIVDKMIFSHQSCFVRLNILLENPFDTRFRFVADYNQLSLLYIKGAAFCYFNRIISRIEIDSGISYDNQFSCFKELMCIDRLPFSLHSRLKCYRLLFVVKCRVFIVSLLPSFILKNYFRFKYKYDLV